MEHTETVDYCQIEVNSILEFMDDLKFEEIENSKLLAIIEPIQLEYLDVLQIFKEYYVEMDILKGKSRALAEMKFGWTCRSILKDVFISYAELATALIK